MTTSSRDEFLAEANVAVLATVDGKGRPHAAPVWYLYIDGEFIVSTGRGSQKHVNVRANPEVTLVIDERVMPYYAVMVQARAEIGRTLTPDQRLELAVRYLGDDLGCRYVEMTAAEDSITLRFRPRKLIEYDPLGSRR